MEMEINIFILTGIYVLKCLKKDVFKYNVIVNTNTFVHVQIIRGLVLTTLIPEFLPSPLASIVGHI